MSCNRRDHSVRPAALTPVLFLVLALPATAQTPGGGAYTEDQANRGQAVFAQQCTECHEADFRGTDHGPELAGVGFMGAWRDRTTPQLFELLRGTMPPGGGGSLSDDDYLGLTAHILRANARRPRPLLHSV